MSGGIDAKVSAEGLGGEGSCSVLRYGDEQANREVLAAALCHLPGTGLVGSVLWAQCFGLRREHTLVAQQG